ncbi:MAG: queuosine precursor transporter [Bacteroidales bacterium]|nr:queuosine precursor transporter [Bacteroidales bacterium]
MNENKKAFAENLYLILTALFIASLVTSNLIFQKFFSWNPFGWYEFQLSVGIIAYPVTFLITDIISEVYGRKRANRVVLAGLFASIFMLLIIIVSSEATATEWSPVGDAEFKRVFGFTFIAVAASMAAYLLAQYVDVQIFHFWKRLTKGKHLWLRNNASTFLSQFIDTFTILILLCGFQIIEWKLFWPLLINGFLFKVLFAIADTPVIYLMIWLIRRKLGLEGYGAEVEM